MKKRNHSRFKRGSGQYKCHACGKQTRETGDDESSCQLCRACFRDSSWENHHNDNHDLAVAKESCNECKTAGFTVEWVKE